MAENKRSYNATWILSLLLGHLGVDRFYLGYVGLGILKLLTGGGFGIWYLVDLILVLTNQLKDKDGHALEGYEAGKKLSWIITAVVVVGGLLLGIASFFFMLLMSVMTGNWSGWESGRMMQWT